MTKRFKVRRSNKPYVILRGYDYALELNRIEQERLKEEIRIHTEMEAYYRKMIERLETLIKGGNTNV